MLSLRLLPVLLLLAACAGRDAVEEKFALPEADIVILGEVHDNPEHHRTQARIIGELAPAAVVFEMLSPVQAVATNSSPDRGEGLRDTLDWDNSGWPDWVLYQPVFEAVGDTPVYGMALPRDTVSRAVTEGAAGIFGDAAAGYGLLEPLPEQEQQAREAHQQAVHCNMLPASLLPGMVEAQRLRDASFARTTLQALEETGGPVVVITGSGHARTDWGMPAALQRAAPAVRVVSLGQLEDEPEGASPYDSWRVAEPTERDDPCAGFAMPGAR